MGLHGPCELSLAPSRLPRFWFLILGSRVPYREFGVSFDFGPIQRRSVVDMFK